MAKNEDIGTVECPIKGCKETALLRKNSRGWLYSACVVHGVIQSGVAGMQEWMRSNAQYVGEPELKVTEPMPEPEQSEQKEVDDLDDWLS